MPSADREQPFILFVGSLSQRESNDLPSRRRSRRQRETVSQANGHRPLTRWYNETSVTRRDTPIFLTWARKSPQQTVSVGSLPACHFAGGVVNSPEDDGLIAVWLHGRFEGGTDIDRLVAAQ